MTGDDINLDWELIRDLRRMVKVGATVPQLVDEIRHRLLVSRQIKVPIDSPFMPILYFCQAFHIRIIEATELGYWSRYDGYMDDEQVNNAVMRYILRQQPFWDV